VNIESNYLDFTSRKAKLIDVIFNRFAIIKKDQVLNEVEETSGIQKESLENPEKSLTLAEGHF